MHTERLYFIGDEIKDIQKGIEDFNIDYRGEQRTDPARIEIIEIQPENQFGSVWAVVDIHVYEIHHLFYIGAYTNMARHSNT